MTIAELKKALEGLHDDAQVFVNFQGTECKPARIFGEMVIAPAGYDHTVSGYAIVVDIDGEPHNIEGSKLTYKMDPYKPGGR